MDKGNITIEEALHEAESLAAAQDIHDKIKGVLEGLEKEKGLKACVHVLEWFTALILFELALEHHAHGIVGEQGTEILREKYNALHEAYEQGQTVMGNLAEGENIH